MRPPTRQQEQQQQQQQQHHHQQRPLGFVRGIRSWRHMANYFLLFQTFLKKKQRKIYFFYKKAIGSVSIFGQTTAEKFNKLFVADDDDDNDDDDDVVTYDDRLQTISSHCSKPPSAKICLNCGLLDLIRSFKGPPLLLRTFFNETLLRLRAIQSGRSSHNLLV